VKIAYRNELLHEIAIYETIGLTSSITQSKLLEKNKRLKFFQVSVT